MNALPKTLWTLTTRDCSSTLTSIHTSESAALYYAFIVELGELSTAALAERSASLRAEAR